MLPEHVEMLNEAFKDEKEKPILDEQQLAENSMILQEALINYTKIKVKYFDEHNYKDYEGYLLHIDVLNKRVLFDGLHIKFDDIMEVNII